MVMDTPSSSTAIWSDSVNSPEFQFWNNPNSLPSTSPLHSADQLFSHGFLLPLHSLPTSRPQPGSDTNLIADPGSSSRSIEPSAHIMSDRNPILSASKRWKEIFMRSDKKTTPNHSNTSEEIKREKVDRKRVKDRKTGNGPGSAELNINIWPFSRSRSAGNNSNRSSKPAISNRKVSSAPCSRSNSSGESKLSRRSCPGSPSRAGVHLGRASPVWQVKRPGPARKNVLNVNAPVCVGSRQGLSCRSDDDNGSGGVVKSGGANLFGFRGLFSKKNNNSAVLTV